MDLKRGTLKDNDPLAKKIYHDIINNPYITEDYFLKEERNDNLEFFFDTTQLPLSNSSKIIKLKILNNLKKHKLTIFNYFDVVESYFNKNYYQMELINDEEIKLNKYI